MTHPALVATLLDGPVMRSGSGSWLVDIEGNRYLDCVAGPGVHLLGHGHPAVISAIERQASELIHSSFQLNEPVIELAEELARLAGGSFQRVFFANSGSEAIETAVKLAKKFQAARGRFGHSIAALENGYHGRSGIALALTGMNIYKTGLPGFSLYPGIVHLPVPRPGEVDLDELGRQLDARSQDDLLAVVAEPVLGVGGVIVPPDGFLRALRELCDARGALLIFDEIFTGLGRTGTTFAFERSGVRPDILVIGKPLGAGLPVGAVLTPDDLGSCWAPVDHSTTFGGNGALVGAVGKAVLGELTAGGLADASERAGNQLMGALRSAAPTDVEVRGQGLLIGLEWRSPDQATAFRRRMMARGVLVGIGGQQRSVVRLTPPLNITSDDLKLLESTTLAVFDEMVRR
ncbi:aspartate aminotransferase family protein [Streptomyces spectabilis]|uniref:Aspartate aminotransferase family protein n=1 Tax=Streptomyces spectabilis TaxID=68270 RepID=A0A5P2X5A5_STRST|nr:aspartate aminotransferase family protein [Streptomyces spectabilis]MCI3899938.1 aspartate aminotransferase family protein [Streptomyces spectabilis]QEV57582.1 aspartate aminotransferase family protein [Streptomyces spectabilis]GGV36280.1 putrescine aminotransferase [Streptomyces spectabilis]